jgi:hypothetical protein
MRFFILGLSLLLLSTSASAASPSRTTGQVGASYQCYDGTTATLALGISACLSTYGSEYLNAKAQQLCSRQCNALSGKCGVNSYRVEFGRCYNVEDIRYSGFTVQCHDGYSTTFSGCANATDLRSRADAICAGRVSAYGKSGVNSYAVLARCN